MFIYWIKLIFITTLGNVTMASRWQCTFMAII